MYTLPNVSAFVGSDIVAGVYLTDLKIEKIHFYRYWNKWRNSFKNKG
ncbi:MAG: hypothetical protein ACLTA5_04815 [Anaerococcus obesiensis]